MVLYDACGRQRPGGVSENFSSMGGGVFMNELAGRRQSGRFREHEDTLAAKHFGNVDLSAGPQCLKPCLIFVNNFPRTGVCAFHTEGDSLCG